MRKTTASMRFILSHIIRSPGKYLPAVLAPIALVAAQCFLLTTISRADGEIDRLYETMPVEAIAAPAQESRYISPWRRSGDVISPLFVLGAVRSKYVSNVYLESGHSWSVLVPAMDDGSFPEDWDSIIGYESESLLYENLWCFRPLLAFNDIDMFTVENSRNYLDDIPGVDRTFSNNERIGDLRIEYADGYGKESFMASGDAGGLEEGAAMGETTAGSDAVPMPVIVPETLLGINSLSLGDLAYLNYTQIDSSGNAMAWRHVAVRVIGAHNRNIITGGLRDAILLPIESLESMLSMEMGYITFKFIVPPEHARDMDSVRDSMGDLVKANNEHLMSGFADLEFFVNDKELNAVVKSMDRTLNLLRLLYPLSVFIASVIAIGLSALMMFQNAKRAAIMRVVGMAKRKARVLLCLEYLIICAFGLALALLSVQLLGWGGDIFMTLRLIGLFFAWSLVGSAVGAVFITMRAPLELLHVRE